MMTGIENITARIRADAEAEAKRIADEAATARAELSLQWEDKAREEYAAIIQQRDARRAASSARAVAAAATDIKKDVLALKQQGVSDAFARALELFGQLPKDEYIAYLARCAADAARTGRETLVFNKRDKKAVGQQAADAANALLEQRGVTGGLTVDDSCADIAGGVIIREGDVETNCSVETAAASLRSELASKIAAMMFG